MIIDMSGFGFKIKDYMKNKEHITIPLNWMADEFFSINFHGWNKCTFSANDRTLNEIIHLAAKTLDCFINLYKEERVFTEPEIGIKQDGTFFVKIGTIEKEQYYRRMEKEKD